MGLLAAEPNLAGSIPAAFCAPTWEDRVPVGSNPTAARLSFEERGGEMSETGQYKYFTVEPRPLEGKRATCDYDIQGRSGGWLGQIVWYGRWRQYVLEASPDVVWSEGCLADVADFIGRANAILRIRRRATAVKP